MRKCVAAFFIREPKYWIGNIQGHKNGWCYREHIFGILVAVQVWHDGQYHSRPHPRLLFEEVHRMIRKDRWNSAAAELCEPFWVL